MTAPIMAANFAYWADKRREAKEAKQAAAEAAAEARGEEKPVVRKSKSVEIYAANVMLVVLVVGGALLYTPLWREANPLVAEKSKPALAESTPSKLAEFLKTGAAPAPIFNYMEWGGYLEWELFQYGPPHTGQMFIDGRFEARQVEVWTDYLSISNGRADWQKTLDKYGIKTLVLNKDFDSDLIPFVEASKTWTKAYEDKEGLVFTR